MSVYKKVLTSLRSKKSNVSDKDFKSELSLIDKQINAELLFGVQWLDRDFKPNENTPELPKRIWDFENVFKVDWGLYSAKRPRVKKNDRVQVTKLFSVTTNLKHKSQIKKTCRRLED